ncbi:MAG: DNA/RNA nuclease SfsA [Acutalibacteraceae bacterium]
MKYKKVVEGVFLERPNRFIAKVLIDNTEETVHVKNTGRCKELLIKGAKVYLSVSDNEKRKTKYDLIAVEKITENDTILVNMDSQIPNDVVGEWLPESELFSNAAIYKREVKFGNSRFDFYVEDGERKVYIEVKGVTLENNGVVSFPDAPTERGVKHIKELISCLEKGFEAYIIFVVQMNGIKCFEPNVENHKEFADVLNYAKEKGVNVLVYDCIVTPDSIKIDSRVEY